MDEKRKLCLDLTNLGILLKDKMKLVKHESEQVNNLKEEIRGIMIENDLKNFYDQENNLTLKCSRSFSFDFGAFKLDYPELTKQYFKEETITTTVVNDVYDKKKIKKEHSAEYKSCEVENTPRLSVK